MVDLDDSNSSSIIPNSKSDDVVSSTTLLIIPPKPKTKAEKKKFGDTPAFGYSRSSPEEHSSESTHSVPNMIDLDDPSSSSVIPNYKSDDVSSSTTLLIIPPKTKAKKKKIDTIEIPEFDLSRSSPEREMSYTELDPTDRKRGLPSMKVKQGTKKFLEKKPQKKETNKLKRGRKPMAFYAESDSSTKVTDSSAGFSGKDLTMVNFWIGSNDFRRMEVFFLFRHVVT